MPKPKAEPRYADHVIYGHGEVLEIRTVDTGFAARVRFPDKSERTIRLLAQYWVSDISPLLPSAPKKRQKPASAEPPPAAAERVPASAQPEAA